MTQTTAPAFRYIGITDECVECQCCGKSGLRSTVILAVLDADQNTEDVTYYGSTCAARALAVKGGSRAVLQSARWAHDKTLSNAEDARRMLAHYGLPEGGEIDADTMRVAMRRYIAQHPNMHHWVAETGIGVRARVLDMVARKRAALAEVALLAGAAA
jgi:hypothetical protein